MWKTDANDGSGIGLSTVKCQAITGTNDDLLYNECLRTNFHEI